MKTRLFLLAALLCMITMDALPQQVNVDWERGTSFSGYRTYAWGPTQHPVRDPLWNQRIVSLVDQQLAAKGLQKVDVDAKPDLLVVYNAGLRQNVSWEGYRTGWYMATGSISQVIENEGTLVVDLADPQRMMIVWRGTSSATLSDKSEKNLSKLQKMVSKMFAKYPPPAGK